MNKVGEGSIMVWECFSSGVTGKQVRVIGTINWATYRSTLEENLIADATWKKLKCVISFHFTNKYLYGAAT